MIVIPVLMEGLATRKDHTIRLSLGTNEVSPEKSSELFRCNQKYMIMALKDQPFTNEEMAALDALQTDYDEGKKSQSQRIQHCLYRLWNQNNEGFAEFRDYYCHKTEKYINHLKNLMLPS